MLKKMTPDEIESIAREAVDNAIDFVESEITEQRVKAQRYFDGEVDIGEEEGRSKVVKTVVRDTVRAIKPSLMRVFLQTDKPVEYIPRSPENLPMAEQATEFMHYTFNECNGYTVLNDAFHDALVKKCGIVKAYWDTEEEQEIYDLSDLNDMEFSAVVGEDSITVLEHETETIVGEMGVEVSTHRVKLARTREKGKLTIDSVPPEEFFVNREAKSIEDAYCVAHRTELRIGDLIEMGYDYDDVEDLSGIAHADSVSDTEEFERRGYDDDYTEEDQKDPAMRLVAVTEVYMKIDTEGTGVPVLHKVTLGGGQQKLLDVEPFGYIPFAVFEVDPEPHTFYGRSIADLLMDDQDASTAVIRGILDNVALVNNPRKRVVDGAANIDDLLNNEIGGIVRVQDQNAIADEVVPFVAGQTLVALQYMDQEIEGKSGVTKASTGLSPDALQGTTAAAVQATVQAQAGQIEVMARNLAEGGMKRLFKIMLRIMKENVTEEQMMRVAGADYVPIDPRTWDTSMDVTVNVGLGTGREDQKQAALMQAFQVQSQIMQTYGPGNGLVSLTQIRNSLADMLALNGIRNAERYFSPMNPETEQAILAQAQQQGQQQPDQQAQAYLQAEQMKVQARAQADMAKIQAKSQVDMANMQLKLRELAASDDLKRDEMDQELLIKAAEILGRYGAQVDTAQIKAMQNQPRNF